MLGDEPQPEGDRDRHDQLGAGAQTQRAALDELGVVVGEAEQRAGEHRADDADRAPVEFAEDQERHADGEQDDDAAHRRRARLHLVPSGPSSRMCWPNSRRRRNSMNFGLRNMQISRAAGAAEQDPAHQRLPAVAARAGAAALRRRHQLPAQSRADDARGAPPREPFTSTVSPLRSSPASSLRGRAASGTRSWQPRRRARSRNLRTRQQRSDGDEHLARRAARRRADLAVQGDAPPARARACPRARPRRRPGALSLEVLDRGAHRHRVGVVAVVDQHDAAGQPTRSPRSAENLTSRRARGVTPSARAAATAASRLQRLWAWENDGRSLISVARRRALADRARSPSRSAARQQLDVAAPGAEGDRAHVGAQVGLSSGSSAGTTARRASGEPGDQLRLRGCHCLQRPEQLEVHRADVDDHAHSGSGDLGELPIWPRPAHRHLEHQRLGSRGRGEDRERHPDLGVEVGGARHVAQRGRSSAARMSFVEVFPVEPVTATTRAPVADELVAPGARERLERRADRGARAAPPPPESLRRERLGVPGRHQHSPRARCQRRARRRRRRPCARRRGPTNRSPGRTSAGVVPRARRPVPEPRRDAAQQLGARGAGEALGAPGPHRATAGEPSAAPFRALRARRARRASRATATSSNGQLAPGGELLTLLVTLAGDQHTSSGRASSIALAIAARGGRRAVSTRRRRSLAPRRRRGSPR